MIVLDWLIEFVYPRYCVACNKYGVFLCPECKNELEIADQICPICEEESLMGWTHEGCRHKMGMDGLIAIYSYRDENVRKIVEGIKFGFNRSLIGYLTKGACFEAGVEFDAVVPIPLHFYRENWRGFNQASEIGKEFERKTGVALVEMLKRTKRTKQQAQIKNKEERKDNLRDAFEVVVKVKNLKILLVDDVFTSGATMRECAKELKKAGAGAVWGLVLAH